MKNLQSLIPWGKRDVFSSLHQEMARLFDDFSRNFEWSPKFEAMGKGMGVVPSIDVKENDTEVVVSAELPGLEEKDINVSLTKDSLTIKGEKKEEREEKKGEYYQMERSYGSFLRTIALPSEVDVNRVDATFKKGVLNIVLPKTEAAKKEVKRIAIKAM